MQPFGWVLANHILFVHTKLAGGSHWSHNSPSLLHTRLVPLTASNFDPLLQWKSNLPSMSRAAAGQSLTVNQLVDMEWRFGGEELALLPGC